ncbi:ATP-binding protein [Actinomadura sp. 9N407]|uniref:ATP-binding protein n=1 Tax=Actinomadura sp. 9N407 TaxID=3375154 RepID=UPI003796BE60
MGDPATLVIKARLESIKEARDFIKLVFGTWGLEDFAARIVVSELATNAIKHGSRENDLVVVRAYRRDEGCAVIETWDRSETLPVLRPENYASESGRGLLLLEQLVTRWGTRPLTEGGKIVYAELEAVPHEG